LGSYITGICEKKNHMNMRLNLKGYGDRAERDYLEYLGVEGRIM